MFDDSECDMTNSGSGFLIKLFLILRMGCIAILYSSLPVLATSWMMVLVAEADKQNQLVCAWTAKFLPGNSGHESIGGSPPLAHKLCRPRSCFHIVFLDESEHQLE